MVPWFFSSLSPCIKYCLLGIYDKLWATKVRDDAEEYPSNGKVLLKVMAKSVSEYLCIKSEIFRNKSFLAPFAGLVGERECKIIVKKKKVYTKR